MNTSFERSTTGKDEWLTPPEIIKELGPFDLDPCSPRSRPWPTAEQHYTIDDDGLNKPWHGVVWMNPPYGNQTIKWMEKLANHGNGIALVFARTETRMFHELVWRKASGLFWFRGRVRFCHVSGTPATNSGGAPSVLVAYGDYCARILDNCKLRGYYTALK